MWPAAIKKLKGKVLIYFNSLMKEKLVDPTQSLIVTYLKHPNPHSNHFLLTAAHQEQTEFYGQQALEAEKSAKQQISTIFLIFL
jgi:hypothetical protein